MVRSIFGECERTSGNWSLKQIGRKFWYRKHCYGVEFADGNRDGTKDYLAIPISFEYKLINEKGVSLKERLFRFPKDLPLYIRAIYYIA